MKNKIPIMAGVIACISAAAAPEITLQQIKTGFKGMFCYEVRQ